MKLPKKGFLLKYSSCIMRKQSAVPAGEPGSCATRCSYGLVAERQRLPGDAPFFLGLSHLLWVPGRKHGVVVSAVAGLRGREMYLRCLADLRGRERWRGWRGEHPSLEKEMGRWVPGCWKWCFFFYRGGDSGTMMLQSPSSGAG